MGKSVNLFSPWFESSNPFSPWFEPYDPFSDDPRPYPADELIYIRPYGLSFIVEPNKPSHCTIQLSNTSEMDLAFRVKTTNLVKYTVQPQKGILKAGLQTSVTVTMRALKERPSDMECNDIFMVQNVRVSPAATVEDITPETFQKEVGNYVGECQMGATYGVPYVSDSEEEETSDNATAVPTRSSDDHITSTKTNDLISTATKEKLSIIQENNRLLQVLVNHRISTLTEEKESIVEEINRLHQELVARPLPNMTLLERGTRRNNGRGELSIYYVLLIAVLGILLVHKIRSSLLSWDFW